MARRALVLPSGVWRFTIGKSNAQIRGPNGETWNVWAHEVNDRTADSFERGQYKRTNDGMVTPFDVRRYIEMRIVGAK